MDAMRFNYPFQDCIDDVGMDHSQYGNDAEFINSRTNRGANCSYTSYTCINFPWECVFKGSPPTDPHDFPPTECVHGSDAYYGSCVCYEGYEGPTCIESITNITNATKDNNEEEPIDWVLVGLLSVTFVLCTAAFVYQFCCLKKKKRKAVGGQFNFEEDMGMDFAAGKSSWDQQLGMPVTKVLSKDFSVDGLVRYNCHLRIPEGGRLGMEVEFTAEGGRVISAHGPHVSAGGLQPEDTIVGIKGGATNDWINC